MTAIYAMYSKQGRQVAIAADDLKGIKPGKVNKLRFLVNRFVIGICGVESPIHAIDSIVKQNKEEDLVNDLTSIPILAAELLDWTEKYIEALFKNGFGKPEHAGLVAKLSQMDTSIVLFDLKDFQLYEMELGKIIPAKKLDANVIKAVPLQEKTLNLFAMARNVRGGDRPGILLPFTMLKPS